MIPVKRVIFSQQLVDEDLGPVSVCIERAGKIFSSKEYDLNEASDEKFDFGMDDNLILPITLYREKDSGTIENFQVLV